MLQRISLSHSKNTERIPNFR